MRQTALAVLSVMTLGGLGMAQVPAPDFWIEPLFLSPNATVLEFGLQGPPNSAVLLFTTPDDPYQSQGARPRRVRTFAHAQLDGTGHGSLIFQVSYQGPLPDVWFGALMTPPSRPTVQASYVHLAGSFAFALVPNSGCVIDYVKDTGKLDVRVNTTPNTTVSIWEADCDDAPFVGFPFNPFVPGIHYVGGGVSDGSGAMSWSGTEPGARCLVVMANGIVIARKTKH